jgi:hypothetical protein
MKKAEKGRASVEFVLAMIFIYLLVAAVLNWWPFNPGGPLGHWPW